MRKIGCAKAHHFLRRKRQSFPGRKLVVACDVSHQSIEAVELRRPLGRRPAPTVEMTDRVRGDFMPLPNHRIDEGDAPPHVILRTAEIDAGGAARLMRALVDLPFGIGEEVDTADEEGEVHTFAVTIHFAGEVEPVLPAFVLGAIVEGNGYQLRRTLQSGSCLYADNT